MACAARNAKAGLDLFALELAQGAAWPARCA
ncbi:hypothetical protein A2U01_0118243, partial [Trifolium medium]|nr:hypothetical protein [Trifolium medium]